LKPGDYSFAINPDGQLVEASGKMKLSVDQSAPLSRDGAAVSVVNAQYPGLDGTADGGTEQVYYTLNYGHWAVGGNGREFYATGGGKVQFLHGASSEPYPDGNRIAITFN